ncbi:hypothetical protein H0H81_001098 [Sphagnurus paluster]|uniref:Stanniocalcin n=1 Tax=Sphagnurus paluster TaxID=117069 RepID=A0A9P7FPX6_9AGAR|nr:hypothetical protein H0H81_001098 [Sphagnurus paluster]
MMPTIFQTPYGATKSIPTLFLTTILTLISIGSLSSAIPTAHAFPTSHAPSEGGLSPRVSTINTLAPSTCANPPRDSCAFYSECVEAKYNCGPQGYPLGYGGHFCEKFGANRQKLSAKGQAWMVDTMQCLQRELIPEATGTAASATCASIQKKAFLSHARCYVDSGLCKLPPTDWVSIVQIVEIPTLFKNIDSFAATLNAAKGCLEAYLFFFKGGAKI